MDRDAEALQAAAAHLAAFAPHFALRQANFSAMRQVAATLAIPAFDGILLDLGVSSHQLDQAERGFSYQQDAPLDMRMDRSAGMTAADLVNTASQAELTDILYRYGEERWAARIAEFIVAERRQKPLQTTGELVELIRRAVSRGARSEEQHPAKRTFQALRIRVNDELTALEEGLEAAISLLAPGGRLAVISFHSLEDRIVKEKLRWHARDCICPPEQPVCTCHHHADLRIVTKKPILATQEELEQNPRSRSAKLRVAEKLAESRS